MILTIPVRIILPVILVDPLHVPRRKIVDYKTIADAVVRKVFERMPDRRTHTSRGWLVLSVYCRRGMAKRHPVRGFAARLSPRQPLDDGNFFDGQYFQFLDRIAEPGGRASERAQEILDSWLSPRNHVARKNDTAPD